jgi:hypothetical protein
LAFLAVTDLFELIIYRTFSPSRQGLFQFFHECLNLPQMLEFALFSALLYDYENVAANTDARGQ